MNLKRTFLFLLIGSVAVSALLGIFIILFGTFSETEIRILGTTATITVMSILGLTCGAAYEAGRLRNVALTGIVCSVVSAVIWIAILWSESQGGEYIVKSVLSLTLLAIALSYSSLISFAVLEKKFRWTIYAAYLTVAMLAGVVLYTIWINNNPNEELIVRVIGSLSILLAALTVTIPIFHKLSRIGDGLEHIDREIVDLRTRLDLLEKKREKLQNTVRSKTV
jgi:hypothetical protein